MKEDDGYPSPLRSVAVQMHEVFSEFRRAGFSRKEALELVAKILTGTVGSMIEENNNKKEED
jgi:pyrroline-5-carboxylate reductase